MSIFSYNFLQSTFFLQFPIKREIQRFCTELVSPKPHQVVKIMAP